ncbi:N-acetyltransferase 5 [Coemansia thaxteri]|uniref:N-acetyltransferase 5 n=1 Tax=Coemansia thaxteri TaxID=2663907 RepID=A0A9W8BHU4_9FUNG|nr:N-acetyltransferase 5 [Coemansia thaxteri]KAJ2009286.1 N-acetyltransferase 5 [Coemansia thaxteri]KAJ2487147.1 N-acetyltransferase 5 [Coemansia sp. RSA 2320]
MGTRINDMVEYQPVDGNNMGKVRQLNSVLFPVRYSGPFYRGLLLPGQFAQVAVYGNSTYVGTIACRKQALGFVTEPLAASRCNGNGSEMLEVYMMTLGVLAPYRRLGIGRQLLAHAIEFAAQDPKVHRVVLHVQIDNDDALRFYHKHGFSTQRMVERYYKNIDPPHAYLLEYRLK